MVAEEIRNIKSGKGELRKFGLTMGIALGVLGGLLLWRGKHYSFYFFILSAAFILLCLALPASLKPIHRAWMSLAIVLGWLMSRVVLTILFFVVITPIALLARLSGRDFLGLRFKANPRDSYWVPRGRAERQKRDYERQF